MLLSNNKRLLGLTWLVLLLLGALSNPQPARADGVPVHEATPTQQTEAKKSFDKAQKLQSEGKTAEAIVAYRESHEIVANPRTLLMIARVRRDSGELTAAEAEYRAALSEAEAAVALDAKQRETLNAIDKDLKELEELLGWLTLQLIYAPAGTRVTIDGNEIDQEQLAEPVRVAPGPLSIVATAPDGTEVTKEISISAGQSATVKLPFARKKDPSSYFSEEDEAFADSSEQTAEPEASSGGRTWAYVACGVGALGLGAFTVFGLMTNQTFSDLEEACPGAHCPRDRRDQIGDGMRYQTFANVGLAAGIVGLGTGAALLIFGGSSEPAKNPPKAEFSLGPGSIELRGRFQ